MLQSIEQDRPSIQDFPRLLRLGLVEQRAHNYLRFSNPASIEAGLRPTSREGIWLFIAEESLSFMGEKLTDNQKVILLDLFSVLRRMYKSADDLWDQSPERREYIIANPSSRVMETLTWENQGTANVTDMPLALRYVNARLRFYYPQDEYRRNRISESFGSFIQGATSALVDFEHLKRNEQPKWEECLQFYKKTTGRIGKTVGQLVGKVTSTSDGTISFLEEVFEKASVVSQIVDDIVDSPLDIADEESPSVVKAFLRQNHEELETVGNYAGVSGKQISHRKFHQIAPQTDVQIRSIFQNFTTGIPPRLQQFLNDFYFALPPSKVSHADLLNKGWHTSLEAHDQMQRYLEKIDL